MRPEEKSVTILVRNAHDSPNKNEIIKGRFGNIEMTVTSIRRGNDDFFKDESGSTKTQYI